MPYLCFPHVGAPDPPEHPRSPSLSAPCCLVLPTWARALHPRGRAGAHPWSPGGTASPPLPVALIFPSVSWSGQGDKGGGGSSARGTRDCTPKVRLLLLLLFFFSRSKIGLRRPAVRRRSSLTLSKDEVVLRPPGCSDDVRDQATLPVSSPFQAVAPLAACLRQAGAQSASAPQAVLARTSPPMFLMEDVVATPDLSATLVATCAVATPVLSVT